jgi:hypothetical protein
MSFSRATEASKARVRTKKYYALISHPKQPEAPRNTIIFKSRGISMARGAMRGTPRRFPHAKVAEQASVMMGDMRWVAKKKPVQSWRISSADRSRQDRAPPVFGLARRETPA